MTETIKQNPRTYIPAAGYDWLLPLYDPLQKLLGSESDHRDLLNQAGLEPGHRVLEIGCGTGNLAILTKLLYPGAKVVGLDPDPKALTRAKLKAQREAVSVHFDCGFSHELPYPNESFDRVFSSFMFHHLNLGEKKQTLEEARRVLAPGGSLHLLDFGGANTRPEGLIARLLHRTERLRDNVGSRIPTLMREGGFTDAREVAHRVTIFGRVTRYRASPPSTARYRLTQSQPTTA
jgi:ubiquinone/menaquinone biosynthesis C-methylase UbiE